MAFQPCSLIFEISQVSALKIRDYSSCFPSVLSPSHILRRQNSFSLPCDLQTAGLSSALSNAIISGLSKPCHLPQLRFYLMAQGWSVALSDIFQYLKRKTNSFFITLKREFPSSVWVILMHRSNLEQWFHSLCYFRLYIIINIRAGPLTLGVRLVRRFITSNQTF